MSAKHFIVSAVGLFSIRRAGLMNYLSSTQQARKETDEKKVAFVSLGVESMGNIHAYAEGITRNSSANLCPSPNSKAKRGFVSLIKGLL